MSLPRILDFNSAKRIKQAALDNPDLSKEFIKEALLTKNEPIKPYTRDDERNQK